MCFLLHITSNCTRYFFSHSYFYFILYIKLQSTHNLNFLMYTLSQILRLLSFILLSWEKKIFLRQLLRVFIAINILFYNTIICNLFINVCAVKNSCSLHSLVLLVWNVKNFFIFHCRHNQMRLANYFKNFSCLQDAKVSKKWNFEYKKKESIIMRVNQP